MTLWWMLLLLLVSTSSFQSVAAAAALVGDDDDENEPLTQLTQQDAILSMNPAEISYVLEPFETYDDQQEWFVDDALNVTATTDTVLFGNASLRVEYTTAEDDDSSAWNFEFGWLQREKPHNCWGASHVSLWFQVVEWPFVAANNSSSGGVTAQLRLTLLDDSDCGGQNDQDGVCPFNRTGTRGRNLEHYSVVVPVTLSSNNDWQQVVVEVARFELQDTTTSTTTSSGNKQKGQLDLNRLRGWKVEWSVLTTTNGEEILSSLNQTTNNKAKQDKNKMVLLFDQLACVGGGDMLGAPFYQGNDITWETAVETGVWQAEFFQSNISLDNSHITLDEDGVLAVDYTVQMVENWGGFIGLTFIAPGPAYYNLTGASDWHLGYHARKAASAPGRTHLRIVLSEASHCTVNCSLEIWGHERWYSFHYVLDDNTTNDGWGDIYLPLVGSREPYTPFWLTGWAGELGNSQLDIANIKGFTLEFNIDSQGDMDSTVSGALDMFNLSAMTIVYNETLLAAIEESGNADICIAETNLYLQENSALFQIKEFLGSKCCQVCRDDETCLYALSTGRDCFIASYLNANMIAIPNTEILQNEVTAFWMDDATRRGDFCDLCDCRESDRTIDCRSRDLLIVPKTFYQDKEEDEDGKKISWTPRTLDLRNNSRLVILGRGSLNSIAEGLEELWLPENMRHIALDSLKDLPALSQVRFEDPGQLVLSNSIAESDGAFADVCCTRGDKIDLATPKAGLTFCNMEINQPGIDASYLPFIEFPYAIPYRLITPSSNFMSEAAESVEKCAEYCAISSECKYFSFDARLPNAEHRCHLLKTNGTGPFRVCCKEDHYADNAGTIPGWTSGLPPRTRHIEDNARAVVAPTKLVLDPSNGYQNQFELSLGSTPIRGAVWITPQVSSSKSLRVSFSPARVVLYDANSTATVVVKVSNVVTDANSVSLVVNNIVESCDVAFMETGQGTTVFIDVVMPQSDSNSNMGVIIAIIVAVVVVLALGVWLYIEQKRKLNDAVWKVREDELEFDDPPEILGRGTFGLVLKGTYRGTEVAVKRVIPPRDRKPNRQGSAAGSAKGSVSSFDKNMVMGSIDGKGSIIADGKTSGTASMRMSSQAGNKGTWSFRSVIYGSRTTGASYKKLKNDFIIEMRHLSKLRHPCITTVMGAVISSKTEPMLVMEFMDHGSLYDLLHNETMIIEGELLLPILRDISQGVRFLHAASPQVVHGDLKAANILVDQKFRAKVADFGLSQKKHVGATGTPFWMAPELLRGESSNTTASDVFAFGVMLAEVYSRKDPYEGEDPREVLRLVADKKVKKRPQVPRHMPAPIQTLMNDCLVDDPEARPSFDELDQRLKRVDAKSVEPTQVVGKHRSCAAGNISLFDIFPRHIAEALRDGKKVEAEHKDVVTIYFSDIVGFTQISSTLPPRKIADMLDRLYSKFDQLSHDHDLYKVETIGDAYMAVTNLVKEQPDDHAKRIAEFAVDAIAAANCTPIDMDDPDRGCVDIRVGFHSGPVVADVVGTRNPRYCLFGDSVNVASRMESNSQPGRIHCSKASAEILMKQLPEMPLTARGEIEIKGKGTMHTFWVNKKGRFEARPSVTSLGLQETHPSSRAFEPMAIHDIKEEHGEVDLSSDLFVPNKNNHDDEDDDQGRLFGPFDGDGDNDDKFNDEGGCVPGSFVDV